MWQLLASVCGVWAWADEPPQGSVELIEKGDVAVVPRDGSATVRNPDAISSADTRFSLGDSCVLRKGGTLKVLTVDKMLLLKYAVSGRQFGAFCPTGALFLVSPEGFLGVKQEQERLQAQLRE